LEGNEVAVWVEDGNFHGICGIGIPEFLIKPSGVDIGAVGEARVHDGYRVHILELHHHLMMLHTA
jgi:hypothetical protein